MENISTSTYPLVNVLSYTLGLSTAILMYIDEADDARNPSCAPAKDSRANVRHVRLEFLRSQVARCVSLLQFSEGIRTNNFV